MGRSVDVDIDVCAKTGEPTRERVTLRGSTTPPWVTVLLLLTVVGFLLATVMLARRFEVRLPFTHAAYDRWRRRVRWSWAIGALGVAMVFAGTALDPPAPLVWTVAGVVVLVGALAFGITSSVRHQVAVRQRGDDLVVTRCHPAFVAAVQGASTAPVGASAG